MPVAGGSYASVHFFQATGRVHRMPYVCVMIQSDSSSQLDLVMILHLNFLGECSRFSFLRLSKPRKDLSKQSKGKESPAHEKLWKKIMIEVGGGHAVSSGQRIWCHCNIIPPMRCSTAWFMSCSAPHGSMAINSAYQKKKNLLLARFRCNFDGSVETNLADSYGDAYISTVHIRGMLRFLRYWPGVWLSGRFVSCSLPDSVVLSPRHTRHVSPSSTQRAVPPRDTFCWPLAVAACLPASRTRGREASSAAAYTGGSQVANCKITWARPGVGRVRKRSGCSLCTRLSHCIALAFVHSSSLLELAPLNPSRRHTGHVCDPWPGGKSVDGIRHTYNSLS